MAETHENALVLADTGQRKLPPDRPPAEGHDERKKKKKLEEVTQVIMDEAMSEKQLEQVAEEVKNAESRELKDENGASTSKFQSYRASLLGYNGVAHSGHNMEEDDLFTNDKDICWKIPEPTEEMRKLMDLYPVVPCTEEEYNEWCEPWNYALILTVLGRKFNLFVLKDLLTNLWGFSSFELIDIPNNYFVVRFQDQELWRSHYRKVLYEGPWVIKQHCVIVQRWTPYFNPYHNALGRVATWVRIPDVPMHLYNKHWISRLGDRIGRTLKVDMNTLQDCPSASSKIQRGKFVRICVEINLQKKLVPKVIAAGSIFNVEYEGLTLICFECGRFGHRHEKCPLKASDSHIQDAQHNPLPPQPISVNTPATNSDEAFGPWMLVNRRNRRPRHVHWSDTRHQQQTSDSMLQRQVSGPGPASEPTAIAQKTRFAPIADAQDLEDGEGSHTARQGALPRFEGALVRKDTNIPVSLVKPPTVERRKSTAGFVLGTEKATHAEKMGNKGDLIIAPPKSPMDAELIQKNEDGPAPVDDARININLDRRLNKMEVAGGPILLTNAPSSAGQIKQEKTNDGSHNISNTMGPKKSNEKRGKIKGQRTHVVVQGSLGQRTHVVVQGSLSNMAQQGPSSMNLVPIPRRDQANYMAKEGQNAPANEDVMPIPTIPPGCMEMVMRDQLVCGS